MEKKFEFHPYDRVLVRDSVEGYWRARFFDKQRSPSDEYSYTTTDCGIHKYCIPYEGNERLHGTSDPYIPPYEPKDGDFIFFGDKRKIWGVGIFKEILGNQMLRIEERGHRDYVTFFNHSGEVIYNGICGNDNIRQATEEEKQILLDALHIAGKEWDAEKKKVVEYRWKPKIGKKYYTIQYDRSEDTFITIYYYWYGSDEELAQWKRGRIFADEESASGLCERLNDAIKEVK